MAYIDFATDTGGSIRQASAPAPRHDPVPTREAGLSALEWSVVAIADGDGLALLRKPGRLAIAFGRMFGASPATKLADPRLEALRRVAVLAWHHGAELPASAVGDLLAAGYTTDQYETVLASISLARTKRKPR